MVRWSRGTPTPSQIAKKKRSSGGGSSSSSQRRIAQQNQINKAINDMKAGVISKSEATARVKNIQRGGGSGLAADFQKFELARQAVQQKAQRDAQAKLLQQKAEAEKRRILKQRNFIITKGAREKVKTSRDVRTGNKLKITEWKKGSNTVRRVEDLTAGTVKYTSFGVGRGGGGVRLTGGVTVGATPTRKETARSIPKLGDILLPSFIQRPKNTIKVNTVTGKLSGINQDTRNEINRLAKKNKRSYADQAKILGFEFLIPFQELGIAVTLLPDFAKSLINNPANILKVPGQFVSGLIQSGAEIIALTKISPTRAIARVGGEVVLIVTGGKAIKITGKVTSKVANKLNFLLKKVKNGKIIVRGTPAQTFMVKGRVRMLAKRVQAPSIKRPFSSVADFLKGRKPGQFKKFTKDPGLVLKLQTVKTGATPLSKQALLAGQEVTAVNAAAQQITNWLKFKKIIRKPFPNQLGNPKNYSVFPKNIGNLIKKFDRGAKLTTREFANVNKWLQKNVAPNITLLERSLYLDPASGLRVSRLGLQPAKSATLRDILRLNFKLWNKAGKPQILVFENAKIAKFPKSLSTVRRKLLAGNKLTVAETNKLIEWQVRVGSGKFKPIGSTIYQGGIELEVTLAPGELIKRIKKVCTVVIENRRVSIVTAEVFKPTRKIILQSKKANLGKLGKKQIASLEKSLSKKLGRKIRVETPSLRKVVKRSVRRTDANIPVLRVKGSRILVTRLFSGAKIIIKRVRNGKRKAVKRKVIKRPVKRKAVKRKNSKRPVSRKGKRATLKRPVRKTPKRPVRKTRSPLRGGRSTKTTKKPPVTRRTPKKFKPKTLRKSVNVFYVKEKIRGKIINLTPRPLTLRDARDFLAYRIDNRLSRSAWFEPLGKTKKVVGIPKAMRGYFHKNRRKLRPFKIRVGKRKQIINGYIEKSKFIQDTRNEKLQLKRLKRRKKRRTIKRKPVRRKPKRKTTKRKPIKRKPTKRRIVKRKRKR